MPRPASTSRKVLFLAPQPYFRLRGVCIAQQVCLEALSAQGMEVDVLTFPFGEDPAPLRGVRIRRLPALPGIRDIPIGPSARKILMDLWSLPWVAASLATGAYGHVHACEESAFLAALLKPLFRFRFIYDMDDVLSLRLARSGFLRSRLLLRWAAAIERWMLGRADVVVTNSRETMEFARRHGAPERVVFYDHAPPLPPALNGRRAAERARLREDWKLGDGQVVLYAGNLEPYQGVELLIDSLPEVFKALPKARCVVIGGQRAQIEALRRRCLALGIGSAVSWLGPRPLADTFALMQAVDVLVSPMTQEKAVPMKLYAYGASGTPVVATDLPNHRQLLDDRTAVLVAPRTGALAAGILRALAEGRGARRRGEAARAKESASRGLSEAYGIAAAAAA